MDIILARLLLTIALGAATGLERQVITQKIKHSHDEIDGTMGVRTFIILSLIGFIIGTLAFTYIALAAILCSGVLAFLLAHYYFHTKKTDNYGVTTEMAAVMTVLIGVLLATNSIPTQVVIALNVVLLLVLSIKDRVHTVVDSLSSAELQGFVAYAIVALVILPFLPNISIHIRDIPDIETILNALHIYIPTTFLNTELLNPFRLWFIVALITGVDVLGYILERVMGKKSSLLMSALIGGFLSSTSTTLSLAQQSKKSNINTRKLAGAALLANASSFFSLTLLLAGINASFVTLVLPAVGVLFAGTAIIGLWLLLVDTKNHVIELSTKEEPKQITLFALVPALKFALLFTSVRLFTRIANLLFGASGFLASIALSGFSGVDAASINIAESMNIVPPHIALIAFGLVNTVNLFAKTYYSLLGGTHQFARLFCLAITVTLVSMWIMILLFLPQTV